MKDGLKIDSFGTKRWYKDGKHHREDGPAIEYHNGHKEWHQNGLRHRLDGPAVEFVDGDAWWYVDGINIKCFNQEEFEKLLKLKAFW